MGGARAGTPEVLLLGPVCVRTGGHDVVVGSARQRAVLARLALQPGVVVSVDALVDTLWGDDPPGNARGNLQSHVSRLRSTIGDETLTFQHGGYRLEIAPGMVDAHRAEALAADGRLLVRDGAPGPAAQRFAEALDLWRGPSLGDLADHLGLAADAARLDELRDRIVDELLESRLDNGEAASMLPEVRRRAGAAPLRESSQLLLVRALHECGQSVEALRQSERYRRVLAEETGLDPGPALADLEHRILSGAPVSTPPIATTARRQVRRPRPRTGSFIGRDDEIARLLELVTDGPLVTVTGPGGIGKTRLVTEVVGSLPETEAVAFVELDAVAPGEALTEIAGATGARTGGHLPTLVDHLALKPLVVVLDSCEHVLDEVRRFASVVLRELPEVRLVTTSRTRLALPGEQVLAVQPLESTGDASPALQLLRDRVVAQDPGASLDGTDDALLEVCRRLDGIPLALELAAARIASLGVDAVADRLDQALDLLGDPGTGRARHGDLRRVVQWSLDNLSPPALTVLEVCAVFERDFDLSAVESVAEAVTDEPVAACVAELVEASILLRADRFGEHRYRMLEIVRALAAERVERGAQSAALRDAHLRWAADLLAQQASRARGQHERAAFERLEVERANIRAALRWAVAAADLEHAPALARHLADLVLYRPDGETLAWLRALAAMDGAAGTSAEPVLCGAAARAAYLAGDLPTCRALADRALAIAPDAPAVHARHSLGVWHLYRGEHAMAIRAWQPIVESAEAAAADRVDARGGIALAAAYGGDSTLAAAEAAVLLEEATALDHPTSIAWARYVWGEVELSVDPGTTARARAAFEASAELARELGADFISGVSGVALLSLAAREGDAAAVRRHGVELLELLVGLGTWPQVWTSMRLIAEHLAEVGSLRDAVLVLDAADRDPAAPAVVGEDARRHARIRAAAASSRSAEPALDPVRATSPRASVVRHVIGVLRGLDESA